MKINPITDNQNFEGSLIVKNKISSQQNYLFNLHKSALERAIKPFPFDLFVEQSKSKNSISLSTGVKGAGVYYVKKNQQNFEEAASNAITDALEKTGFYKKMVKANMILDCVKSQMINVFMGKYKEAHEAHKALAKLAVEDFETYKQSTNFKISGFPISSGLLLMMRSLKYKIYMAFSKKTPEEKKLYQMNKEYIKQMKAQNKKLEPQEISMDCLR